jgi:hypothetical protein
MYSSFQVSSSGQVERSSSSHSWRRFASAAGRGRASSLAHVDALDDALLDGVEHGHLVQAGELGLPRRRAASRRHQPVEVGAGAVVRRPDPQRVTPEHRRRVRGLVQLAAVAVERELVQPGGAALGAEELGVARAGDDLVAVGEGHHQREIFSSPITSSPSVTWRPR